MAGNALFLFQPKNKTKQNKKNQRLPLGKVTVTGCSYPRSRSELEEECSFTVFVVQGPLCLPMEASVRQAPPASGWERGPFHPL